MFKFICLILLGSLSLSSNVVRQADSSITIYNGGQTEVKDIRQVNYTPGRSTIYFNRVASTLQPDTIKIYPGSGNIQVLESYYNNGEQNEDKMSTLKNNINKTISFRSDNATHIGKLIAFGPNWVKIISSANGRTQFYDNYTRLSFPTMRTNRFTNPTIVFTVQTKTPRVDNTEASYRTSGLSWAARYNMYLYPNENRANLTGFVSIDNNSGKNFINTNLSLVTGEVKVVQDFYVNAYQGGAGLAAAQTASYQMAPARNFVPQPVSDYYMYSLSRKVNVTTGSNKQIQLFNTVNNVPVLKQYLAGVQSGASPQEVRFSVQYTINNNKSNGLGEALPAGTVRVYKKDSNGRQVFVGEDRIEHTPQSQNITIQTGTPFDLKANYTILRKVDLQPKKKSNQNTITSSQQSFYTQITQGGFTQGGFTQNNGYYTARLQLSIINSGSKQVRTELTLYARQKNLTLSYEPTDTDRWRKIDVNTYKLWTNVTANSTKFVRWNERYSD